MKRAEFQANEQNISSLDEILRLPVMRAALEIVRQESIGLPDPVSGVDYQAQVAVSGAFTVGSFRVLEKLESLARPPRNLAPGMPKQTLFDDAARDRLRAQGIYSEKEISEIPSNGENEGR